MKTTLLVPVMAVAALAMLTAGCDDKVKKLEADNRRASAEIDRLNGENANLQRQVGTLNAQVTQLNTALGENAGTFNSLKSENDKLRAANGQLLAKIRDLGQITVNIGETLPPEMNEALRALAAAHPGLIEFLPKYGMVKFKSDLTFELGKDDLSPKAAEALKAFAGIVNSSAARKFNVYVAGHTDDVPVTNPANVKKYGENWGLSAFRARSVVRALATDGVAQDRMAIIGFSKYHPIQPNKAGNKGNVANRRVEIWIVSPDRLLTAPSDAAPPTDKEPEAPAAPAAPAESSGS